MSHSTQQRTAADPSARRLTLVELAQALQAVDPAVVLVPSRILRRVIKSDTGIAGIGLRVPHRKTYTIARSRLFAIVEADELDLPHGQPPDAVLLVAQPTSDALLELSAEQVLSKYWRLLFHAKIHQALDHAVAEGRLTPSAVEQRIDRLGQAEFQEIRHVLRQEDLLLPPKSDLTVYIEFAAVYWELRYFAESFLPAYFPDIRDFSRVEDILREDLDPEWLFQSLRPSGAPEMPWRGDLATIQEPPEREFDTGHAPGTGRLRRPLPFRFRTLERRAARAAAVGNLVRAAIFRMRAARLGSSAESRQCRADARADLNRLAHRLQRALGFSNAEAEDWAHSLIALLDFAALGIWTPEARMLYDLQKVCVDHERGVYALDLPRWIRSLGRMPLKRALPGQRDVLMSKHLAAAAHRLRAVRLSGRVRGRLDSLLQSAIRRTEEQLRARFRPKIESALDRVELMPRNVPERVARRKLTAELLDQVSEQGFLSMGDLRDALSRNNLKLPDLASFQQFVWGDQLLEADIQLAETLDGVYRRGEIYLRLPQRLSSLAFGLPRGRFLTRYVALPFGGAFLVVEFVLHMINLVRAHLLHVAELLLPLWAEWLYVGLLGSFAFGLMHRPRFRRTCRDALRNVGRALHTVLILWPSRLLELPWIRLIVSSRVFRWLTRYAIKPLLVSGLLLAATDSLLRRWPQPGAILAVFLAVNLLLNSRLGRSVDEMVTDFVVHAWHRFRIHVIAAVFRFIVEIFNELLEGLERLLYTVDEWLRFRSGEGPLKTAAKTVVGLVWVFVHYFVRLCVTTLVEPQVNPIKHFPVVTVSHKVIGPYVFAIVSTVLVAPLGALWANVVAGIVTFLTPGAFGFLAWELKENWRLYAANRPRNLEPVVVGHHGENVLQLLRPGFRSGTIPKLYARLRRANRKGFWTGQWRYSRKYQEGLHHVEERLRRFVDRELLALLAESHGWPYREIATGDIHLGSNRITIELYCPELSPHSLWLHLDENNGVLIADVAHRGWLDQLPPDARDVLQEALAGFYKMAAVDVVREQLEARLPLGSVTTQITEQGLVVRPRDGRGQPRFYPLGKAEADMYAVTEGSLLLMSPGDCRALLFSWQPVPWDRWVAIWQADFAQAKTTPGLGQTPPVLPG